MSSDQQYRCHQIISMSQIFTNPIICCLSSDSDLHFDLGRQWQLEAWFQQARFVMSPVSAVVKTSCTMLA